MINHGSAKGFEEAARKLFTSASCIAMALSLCVQLNGSAATASKSAVEKKSKEKTESKTEKKTETKTPEVVVENVQNVTTEQLVDKPHEWLNKNVKFVANFHAFSSLALDYKPAMRASKNYLSFLVFRPNSKVPFSELKLAMALPKEKDPENTMLTGLKEGDELEITGHVFATALDEPWVDVLKLKKLSSAPEKKEEEAEKKAEKDSGTPESEIKQNKIKGVKPLPMHTPEAPEIQKK